MRVGVVLTAVIVVAFAALTLAVDGTSTSTAGLAYFFLALYAVAALILVWFCIFLITHHA
jgi:hypothetical protein